MYLSLIFCCWALLLSTSTWAKLSQSCQQSLTQFLTPPPNLPQLDLATFQRQTWAGTVAHLPTITSVEILGTRTSPTIWRIHFQNDQIDPIVVKIYPSDVYTDGLHVQESKLHLTIAKMLKTPTDLDQKTNNHFLPLSPQGIQLRPHSITVNNVTGRNLHHLLQDTNIPLNARQYLAQMYQQKAENLLAKISQVLSQDSYPSLGLGHGPAEQVLSHLRPLSEVYPDLASDMAIHREVLEFFYRGEFFVLVLTPENIVVSYNRQNPEQIEMNLANFTW